MAHIKLIIKSLVSYQWIEIKKVTQTVRHIKRYFFLTSVTFKSYQIMNEEMVQQLKVLIVEGQWTGSRTNMAAHNYLKVLFYEIKCPLLNVTSTIQTCSAGTYIETNNHTHKINKSFKKLS